MAEDTKGGPPPGLPPVITDDIKKALGELTADQWKTGLPKAYEVVGNSLKPVIPEKYEVKLPDKAVLSSDVTDRASAVARELGLVSNAHAQRIIDFANGEAATLAAQLQADYSPGGKVFEELRQRNMAEALKAPDLGNGSPEALQAKVALTTTFMKKYFPDKVREMLDKTGIGNDPDFFRAIFKMGAGLKEDGFVAGPSKGTEPPKSRAEKLYPNMKSEKQTT